MVDVPRPMYATMADMVRRVPQIDRHTDTDSSEGPEPDFERLRCEIYHPASAPTHSA